MPITLISSPIANKNLNLGHKDVFLIGYNPHHKGYQCLHSSGESTFRIMSLLMKNLFPISQVLISPLSLIHVCQVLTIKCQMLLYKSFKHPLYQLIPKVVHNNHHSKYSLLYHLIILLYWTQTITHQIH